MFRSNLLWDLFLLLILSCRYQAQNATCQYLKVENGDSVDNIKNNHSKTSQTTSTWELCGLILLLEGSQIPYTIHNFSSESSSNPVSNIMDNNANNCWMGDSSNPANNVSKSGIQYVIVRYCNDLIPQVLFVQSQNPIRKKWTCDLVILSHSVDSWNWRTEDPFPLSIGQSLRPCRYVTILNSGSVIAVDLKENKDSTATYTWDVYEIQLVSNSNTNIHYSVIAVSSQGNYMGTENLNDNNLATYWSGDPNIKANAVNANFKQWVSFRYCLQEKPRVKLYQDEKPENLQFNCKSAFVIHHTDLTTSFTINDAELMTLYKGWTIQDCVNNPYNWCPLTQYVGGDNYTIDTLTDWDGDQVRDPICWVKNKPFYDQHYLSSNNSCHDTTYLPPTSPTSPFVNNDIEPWFYPVLVFLMLLIGVCFGILAWVVNERIKKEQKDFDPIAITHEIREMEEKRDVFAKDFNYKKAAQMEKKITRMRADLDRQQALLEKERNLQEWLLFLNLSEHSALDQYEKDYNMKTITEFDPKQLKQWIDRAQQDSLERKGITKQSKETTKELEDDREKIVLSLAEIKLKQNGRRYAFKKTLGAGNFGTTFLVEVGDERYALKNIVCKSEQALEEAKKEAAMMCGLDQCDHVVQFIETFIIKNEVYISMNFCEGGTVYELLVSGKVPGFGKEKIIRHVAKGLAFLHEKDICHRDIKPKNLLIRGDNVVLGDLGLSRAVGNRKQDMKFTSSIGYFTIKPPEVWAHGTWTTAGDVWQLGLVALGMLTLKNLEQVSKDNFGMMKEEQLFKILAKEDFGDKDNLTLLKKMLRNNRHHRCTAAEVVKTLETRESKKSQTNNTRISI